MFTTPKSDYTCRRLEGVAEQETVQDWLQLVEILAAEEAHVDEWRI